MHTKEKTLVESLQLLINNHDNKKSFNDIHVKETDLVESLRLLFERKKEDDQTEEQPQEQLPQDQTEEQPQEQLPQDQTEEQPQEQLPQDQEQPPAEENEQGFQDEENSGDFQDNNGMDEETTLEDVGKMYELKQIHYRLIAVRNHLEIFVEEEFDEVKNTLTKAINLFDLVIDNYDKYKEKIDEIIIMYYKFIQDVYELTKKKYRKYTNKFEKKNAGLQ